MCYLSRDPLKTGKRSRDRRGRGAQRGEMRKNKQGEDKRRKAESEREKGELSVG